MAGIYRGDSRNLVGCRSEKLGTDIHKMLLDAVSVSIEWTGCEADPGTHDDRYRRAAAGGEYT